MFHPHWREEALGRLGQTFDMIVIGGGITGCGILLDASQRGLRTLLIEQADIASGTSSRSSKLIHGGLRYLKQMQFRITRLACRERDRMASLSPHLVKEIRFLYPANTGDKVKGWKVDLGLKIYDTLTRRPEKHSRPTLSEVGLMAPGLDTSNLERALAYNDAMADDARLTLAVATTGFAYGGLVLTRAEAAEAIRGTGGEIRGVRVNDLLTGKVHDVRAHLVINAAGIWVDRIRERFGLPGKRVRPSRGTHIILPLERMPIKAAVTVPSPDDGRPVFLVPHPEGVLVGTTDIFHDGSLEDPRPTRDEVGYLLRSVHANFPDRGIAEADIVGAFAGLRPILDSAVDNPSEASRDEDVWEEHGMLSISGGKLTTWRSMAEEVVDSAINLLPGDRIDDTAGCATKGTPLSGLAPPDLPDRLERVLGLSGPLASAMSRRLCGAAWLAPGLARDSSELAPLVEGTDLTAAEVRVHLKHSAVARLEDLLLRRARFGMWNPNLAHELIPHLRPLFQEELGWDSAHWEAELAAVEPALEAWSPKGVE